MVHDFDTSHGGTGDYSTSTNDCNYAGFMSYGDHASEWSTCSVSDFTAHYTSLANSWCMPASTSACSTDEATTTTATTTTSTTTTAATTTVNDEFCPGICKMQES